MYGTRGGQNKGDKSGKLPVPSDTATESVSTGASKEIKISQQEMFDLLSSLQSQMANVNPALQSLTSNMAELRTDVNEIKSLKTSLEFTQEQVDLIQEGVTKLAVKTEEQDQK